MFSIKRIIRISAIAPLFLALITLQSCGTSKSEKVAMQITVSSEGPYFSGSNSFFNEYNVDLASLISEKSLTTDDIKSVKLVKAAIRPSEGTDIGFNQFSSASLQVVSDNTPMTSIAILNPIPDGASASIQLNASEEADLTDYFKEASFTYLLDLDFKEDDYSDAMSLSLDLELIIEYN
jgi:hypothetical protein